MYFQTRIPFIYVKIPSAIWRGKKQPESTSKSKMNITYLYQKSHSSEFLKALLTSHQEPESRKELNGSLKC
jgi:hypothetical protein